MARSSTDRGQAFTLEGIIASLIIVGALLVGLQAVDKAPWTTGGDDIDAENRQTQARDLLAVSADDGSLSRALRCVEDDGTLYEEIGKPSARTNLGRLLGTGLTERNFDYRLSVNYWDPDPSDPGWDRTWIAGEEESPGETTVTATRMVTLTDNMTIQKDQGLGCRTPGETLEHASDFYIPDVDESSEVYNVVEVRLEVWREGSA